MKKNILFSGVMAFCGLIKKAYKKSKPLMGLPLVYMGVVLMVVFYFTNLTNHNFLTFLPVLLILLGIITYVQQEKAGTTSF